MTPRCRGQLHLVSDPWAALTLDCASAPGHVGDCSASWGEGDRATWGARRVCLELTGGRAWRLDPARRRVCP